MKIKIIDHNTGKVIEYDHVTKMQTLRSDKLSEMFEMLSEVSENVLTYTSVAITKINGMKPVDIIKIEDGKQETTRIL